MSKLADKEHPISLNENRWYSRYDYELDKSRGYYAYTFGRAEKRSRLDRQVTYVDYSGKPWKYVVVRIKKHDSPTEQNAIFYR